MVGNAGSKPFKFSLSDLWPVLGLFLLTGLGAMVTLALDSLADLDLGEYTAMLVPVIGAILMALQKWITDTRGRWTKPLLLVVCLSVGSICLAQEPEPEPQPDPRIAVARIVGPDTAEAGDLIVLSAQESVGKAYAWTLVSKPTKTFLPVDGGVRVVFASGTQAEYVFVLAVAAGDTVSITQHTVTIGKPPAPSPVPPALPGPGPHPTPGPGPAPINATATVYVYEKDDGGVPPAVSAALSELNLSMRATTFEQNTVDADGQVPDQYRVALAAAREAGLPALIVLAGESVKRVMHNPRTKEQVLEAARAPVAEARGRGIPPATQKARPPPPRSEATKGMPVRVYQRRFLRRR